MGPAKPVRIMKAWQHSPSPDVQQELQSLRERRGSKAVPRGFLKEAGEPQEESGFWLRNLIQVTIIRKPYYLL